MSMQQKATRDHFFAKVSGKLKETTRVSAQQKRRRLLQCFFQKSLGSKPAPGSPPTPHSCQTGSFIYPVM
ncbi:hypothetical protein GN956_G5185 [Arapaima gigas]